MHMKSVKIILILILLQNLPLSAHENITINKIDDIQKSYCNSTGFSSEKYNLKMYSFEIIKDYNNKL
jgi:hypothetical protein